MNRTLKTGLIGFSVTIIITILFKLSGLSPSYIAPFALPWAMLIIIGLTKKKN